MPAKPCITAGCSLLAARRGPRCPQHEREYQARRNASPARAKYRDGWAKLARESIAAYRRIEGDICPGYWCGGPHPINPSEWVCDHDLGPMCRAGNSRKAAVHDRDGHKG